MGGIGKTTLAEAIFKQIPSRQFGGVCLILNVKEKIKKNGSEGLQKDILSKVLNELVDPIIIPPIIKKRINQTRVFIVLDDVDDLRPLETLARRVGGFGQGSRIIITSRDKSVLLNCEVDDQNIYEVQEFNHLEALQLFCNRAFNQNLPTIDLWKLSNDIVNYAGGNPLALIVLGSSLNKKNKKVWESAVNQLRTNVDRKIFDVLKLSYDGLNAGEQEVFLDIACFFKGRDREYVATILDDCEYSLSVLIDKSLIFESDYGSIEMHDLLQDLGRDIVHKESPKEPGKRSRLWRQEDVQDTLKHGDGTNVVQGIFLDMSKIKDIHLSLEAFNKMYNLRLLKFYNFDVFYNFDARDNQSFNKVHFREGLNNAPFDKMRSFIWFEYPLPALSSNFNLEKLVELNLSYSSNLERLWEDTKDAPKLKWLRLDYCPRLIEVPDLSKSPLLERIYLGGCSHLTKIQNLSKLAWLKVICLNGCSSLIEIPNLSESPLLETINLQDCSSLLDFPLLAPCVNRMRDFSLRGLKSLRSFPSTMVIHFEYPEYLSLSSCINLTTFPPISGRLSCLSLRGTAIDEVPPSIENIIQLDYLILSECKRLKHISTNICKLKSLEGLNLENCSQLVSFPEILEKMECLKFLHLSGTAIKELPHSIEHLTNLSELYLIRCKNLEKLPSSISNLISLKCLDISECPKLEILLENSGNLKSLEDLSMDRIAISQLPSTMIDLNKTVNGFGDSRFTDLFGLSCSLTKIYLNDCNLNKIPEDIGCLSSLEFLELSGNNFESLPKSMKQLYKLTSLKVDDCNMLHSLTELPPALEHLSATDCNMLQSLTDLPSALEHLAVSGCNMLQSLTELPSALKHLSASGCKQLRSIPDASEFANLVDAKFLFTNCLNLKETAVSNMLATLKKGYEEGEDIGELTFCCPGSKVPGWLYESSIEEYGGEVFKIKFPMPWDDCFNGRRFLGVVVCAVVAFEDYYIEDDFCIHYKYKCSDGDESSPNNITDYFGTSRSVFSGGCIRVCFGNETLINSDHIAFGFCKTSVPWISESDFTNCSFECWLSDEENPNCRKKSFGVCPIYAKDNITLPSFNKQKTIKTLDLFH